MVRSMLFLVFAWFCFALYILALVILVSMYVLDYCCFVVWALPELLYCMNADF